MIPLFLLLPGKSSEQDKSTAITNNPQGSGLSIPKSLGLYQLPVSLIVGRLNQALYNSTTLCSLLAETYWQLLPFIQFLVPLCFCSDAFV